MIPNAFNFCAIPELSEIVGVEKIHNTVLAKDSGGAIYGWGDNQYGQVGNDSTNNLLSPIIMAHNDFITTMGTGNVNSTVPIAGTINALTISVTHPASVTYTIDPNLDNGFVASDIAIENNPKVPIRVTIQSFESHPDAGLQFTDVLPESQEWDSLNLDESRSYIALGLKYKDEQEWLSPEPAFLDPVYAADLYDTSVGVLSKGASGTLKLSAKHGFAFDRSYTAEHKLIFKFSLV